MRHANDDDGAQDDDDAERDRRSAEAAPDGRSQERHWLMLLKRAISASSKSMAMPPTVAVPAAR